MNRSPWIEEVDVNRPVQTLHSDLKTDIAIVGAGIAGMSTAYFLLTRTKKNVVVVEQNRLAHGATGHNAGMVIAEFELPLHQLAEKFGSGIVVEAEKEIENGWSLLDEMIVALEEPMPYFRSIGYGGLRTLEEVHMWLGEAKWENENGFPVKQMVIADTAPFHHMIESKYEGLYEIQPHARVLELLDVAHTDYVVAKPEDFGVMNSALFCERLLLHFQKKYPQRFNFFEHTPVSKVALHESSAILDAGNHTIEAQRVVMCTNGFENIRILNISGLDIDTRFHHLVTGVIGFMSAYVDDSGKPPGAHWYTMPYEALALDGKNEDITAVDPFIYTSRRPHKSGKTLVAMGGPEMHLEDLGMYDRAMEYPPHVSEHFSAAVKSLRKEAFATKDGFYEWHGLMGYTPTGVRVVGAEPKNPVLMYNLGCNGIGILPSIAGGLRISKLVCGEKLPPSIFDPREDDK